MSVFDLQEPSSDFCSGLCDLIDDMRVKGVICRRVSVNYTVEGADKDTTHEGWAIMVSARADHQLSHDLVAVVEQVLDHHGFSTAQVH